MAAWKRTKQLALIVGLAALLAALPSFAADGDKSTIKGLITSIQGDTIVVRDGNNVDHAINVSPETV